MYDSDKNIKSASSNSSAKSKVALKFNLYIVPKKKQQKLRGKKTAVKNPRERKNEIEIHWFYTTVAPIFVDVGTFFLFCLCGR